MQYIITVSIALSDFMVVFSPSSSSWSYWDSGCCVTDLFVVCFIAHFVSSILSLWDHRQYDSHSWHSNWNFVVLENGRSVWFNYLTTKAMRHDNNVCLCVKAILVHYMLNAHVYWARNEQHHFLSWFHVKWMLRMWWMKTVHLSSDEMKISLNVYSTPGPA